MSQRARAANTRNHVRQLEYLRKRIVMLPKLRDEKKGKEKK